MRILFLSALAATPAFARPQVFKATALFTKPGWDSKFNNLEQLGVERAAEKKAYAACVSSGATDCVNLEGTTVTRCNFMIDLDSAGCEAQAFARGNDN